MFICRGNWTLTYTINKKINPKLGSVEIAKLLDENKLDTGHENDFFIFKVIFI